MPTTELRQPSAEVAIMRHLCRPSTSIISFLGPSPPPPAVGSHRCAVMSDMVGRRPGRSTPSCDRCLSNRPASRPVHLRGRICSDGDSPLVPGTNPVTAPAVGSLCLNLRRLASWPRGRASDNTSLRPLDVALSTPYPRKLLPDERLNMSRRDTPKH